MTTSRVYRVAVELPYEVASRVDTEALFTAVADAVHDWEPKVRDGWDTDVYAEPVEVPNHSDPEVRT